MQRQLAGKIISSLLIMFFTGCSSAPTVQDNRADEQRANADKAHKELSQEVKKIK